MGTLVHSELLENSKYRKFLHKALPWYGHVGISHMFMTTLVDAAKTDSFGYVDFDHCNGFHWTGNIWVRPLISRNVDYLMTKLHIFILSLLDFSEPSMRIVDSEWGEVGIQRRQFIGNLSVLPYTRPGEQSFDLIVQVRLKIRRHRKKAVPIMQKSVRLELLFEKHWNVQVLLLC
jgi:hypothetical protein